jgi:hypothetical protein
MKKFFLVSSIMLLTACSASNDTAEKANENDVATQPAAAPEEASMKIEDPAKKSEEKTVSAARSESWSCSGGPGSFSLSLSNMTEYTNPRGGSETSGSYRIKGDEVLDIPASGKFSIRGGITYLNDTVDFTPAQDGSESLAHFFESGDAIECNKQ